MNFLGIGVGELLLIMIIAAMVVGPERMVELSRTAGRLLGKLRRETDAITKEFREAISSFDEVEDIAAEARAAFKDVSEEMTLVTQDAQAAIGEVKQIASETKAEAVAAGAVVGVTAPAPVAAQAMAGPSVSTIGTPRPATTVPSPTPAVAAVVTPLLDGEVSVATPAVARGMLPPDEATEVALADLVPEDVADMEPIEVRLPTLVVELPEVEVVASDAPKPKPKGRPQATTAPGTAEPAEA